MNLHTILGAGGAVASQLVPVLLANNEKIRLVSRHPKPVDYAETMAADITDYTQTLAAIKGSAIVYLLIGLPYDIRVWRESWPKIMTNVINACKETGSALIFFDNVYMYGKVDGVMTEETPFNPNSKKGEVRAAIASQLLSEMNAGNIRALIARSADFYGPVGFNNSALNIFVFDKLRKGKKAQWLGDPDVPHSFTYVPDAANALYMLSNRDEALGQTWHVPTADNPLTGREYIQAAATAMQQGASFSVLPKWMLQMAGLFNRTIKEVYEMTYQNDYPYLFDSSRFNQAFGFTPTSYREGIAVTAKWAMEINNEK